ncbi:permease-like cell division protein FtsX [Candidatus Riflebacteria bacterium]
MRKFSFFFHEALESLWRSRVMTIVTVTTISISLLLVGSFYLSMANVSFFVEELKDDFQVIVYLKESVDENSLTIELEQIKKWPQIKNAVYISPEEARQILAREVIDEELKIEIKAAKDLILPAAIKLMVRDVNEIPAVAKRLKSFTYVEDVAYGQGMVNNIQGAVGIYNAFSVICIILLCVACTFIISNTIKLNILNRGEEIEIMKLVGATPWFIRWPFLIEGCIQGFLGAAIAIIIISIFYPFFLHKITTLAPFFPTINSGVYLAKLALKLLLFGTLLGSIGSLFSLRKLKTI